eukprot:TRINITY_DN3730_c0_g2_i1.p1 TRINITY_DN3730_c0_g2~~TRINITY_DN3730_c0_g2_i1.p1  ORF type:complete len:288 (+),score=96.49 TRINITY_DN3730_c0_g2_i1:77-865(+)
MRVVAALASAATAAATAPVVGIYPTIDTTEYLEAYKEWVGQWGAKSVVFPEEWNETTAEKLFSSVNGFLIPGGGKPLSPSAKAFIQRAVKANKEGDYFPVYGTCLGFEWIVETFGGVSAIEKGFDSQHLPSAVNFTSHAAASRTFAGANQSLRTWFTTLPITYNNHVAGITPAHEEADAGLTSEFNVLSTSVDRKGRPFIAQIEGKTLPIYGNQFHPEKIQFVHDSKKYPGVPRSPEAVAGAKYLAGFFVSEVRKNKHMTSL